MAAARPISDSPWFWVYLFGTAALIALALVNPKFGPRQAQIEREYQGRTRAAQNLSGVEPDLEMSTAERTLVTLRPLFLGLAAITAVGWIVFWWTRQRANDSALSNETSSRTSRNATEGVPYTATPPGS